MKNIYESIAARTGGNIYIGVVGPVRTGKSTLIKRVMEQLVIPNIEEPYRRERAKDELPQSGSGKTIMTSEPKFVPEEAVEITPDGSANLRVRMIDSVGYMIDGAVGAEENGEPRMVTTPWYDYEIPLTEAAELGTKKVMDEHATIGIVVTTDGSITDIPREDYIKAERKAIADMQATGKPFVVIINSQKPKGDLALSVKESIMREFGVTPIISDCQAMDTEEIKEILCALLYTFPMSELHIHLPRWMDTLESSHPVKSALYSLLPDLAQKIKTLGNAESILTEINNAPNVSDYTICSIDLGTGCIHCSITFPESFFYEVLSEKAGLTIDNDATLLSILSELTAVKREYDKISDALASVKATGYGIVMPNAEEMKMETPELLRKNGAYGVKLKAGAPSIHMIRVDIDTEISPMVGGEQQSQDLIHYLSGEDPEKLWQSNIFGKSVYDLLQEGLTGKLLRTPDDVRAKIRGSLTRVVNEGANGLICLIL